MILFGKPKLEQNRYRFFPTTETKTNLFIYFI